MKATNLDEYMQRYGALLGKQTADRIDPLHVPGRDAPYPMELEREAFPPQAHVITAGVKALDREKALLCVGACGTGKTLMGAAMAHVACHRHARGRPYRAIVFCPPHLTGKWARELLNTIPGAAVHRIDSYHDVTRLRRSAPAASEWWIVSNNTAKMGPAWRPSFNVHRGKEGILHCPQCGEPIEEEDKEEGCMIPVDLEYLSKKRRFCEHCSGALWTYRRDIDRWPVATYVHKRLKGFFRYLIVDEVHEEKGDDTARANAMGSMAAAVTNVVALTGTLIGGQADHLRTLLFRLAPRSLVAEGLGWKDHMPFNERYGRIEKRVVTVQKHGKSNSYSKGSQTRTTKYVRPGIMPRLFSRHLMGNTVFLSLEELADSLPPLEETVVPVAMDREQANAYGDVERALTAALKPMVARGNKRLLGTMLQTLLCYCDQPWGWGDIGYLERQEGGGEKWVHVCTPESLGQATIRPKEAELVKQICAEAASGRQAWAFTTMTDKRDVCERLKGLLEQKGIRTAILRSKVLPRQREAWIAEVGARVDCVLSHPQLVETGLDLFEQAADGGYRFNFATLMFYLTGYNLFTLRQASRRAWRIAQRLLCRVKYFYYQNTMQERAMALMGKKLAAAEALEGKFSSEGLAAMAGDEGSIEMALAKSLMDKLASVSAVREWQKVCKTFEAPVQQQGQQPGQSAEPTIALPRVAPTPAILTRRPRGSGQLTMFDSFDSVA